MLPTIFEMTIIPATAKNLNSATGSTCTIPSRGPITITWEDGINQVVVRNVKTGEKRIAFQRAAASLESRLNRSTLDVSRLRLP